MRYMGGKSRIAKDIAGVINAKVAQIPNIGNLTFVSLFCGSCVVESKINIGHKVLNDKHEYLIALLDSIMNHNGAELLPDSVSREDYYYVKEHKDENKVFSANFPHIFPKFI